MKIIIVDDNYYFRKDLKFYLESKLNHKVIGEAGSGEEFMEMKNIHEADIILMDIVMVKMDGFTTSKKITQQLPTLKIIAITMHFENIFLLRLMESGFKGFVNKTEIFSKIDLAIHEVYNGNLFFPDDILSRITE